jgi:hypothetical protein
MTKEVDDMLFAILLENGLVGLRARVATTAVLEGRVPVLGSGHDQDMYVFQVIVSSTDAVRCYLGT